MKKWLPYAIAGVMALWPLSLLIPKHDPKDGFATESFGRLPVLSNGRIQPLSTAQLKVDAAEGSYTMSASGGDVRPATVKVSAQRRSSQNDLLLP